MKNVENKEKMTMVQIDDAELGEISGGKAKRFVQKIGEKLGVAKKAIEIIFGDDDEEENKNSTIVKTETGVYGSW